MDLMKYCDYKALSHCGLLCLCYRLPMCSLFWLFNLLNAIQILKLIAGVVFMG